MNKILWILLFFLLLIIGKSRGVKTFFSFLLSIILIIIYILLMGLGMNSIVLAIIICILASVVSIFFLNGYSSKTKSAFLGVMVVLFLMFILIYFINKNASIGAFGDESLETIGMFSHEINYDMSNVIVGVFLVCVIGTIIDTSMSVSSAMNEILENNPKIKEKELFDSGMNVGGDILSTTINTLFFALISTFIGFFMWHKDLSIEYIVNYKLFSKDLIQLSITFIGSILIIPVTSYISSKILIHGKFNFRKIKKNITENN